VGDASPDILCNKQAFHPSWLSACSKISSYGKADIKSQKAAKIKYKNIKFLKDAYASTFNVAMIRKALTLHTCGVILNERLTKLTSDNY
jgi:hypothetical protein